MINTADIIVWDTETGGKDPNTCELIQVAGKAYNGRTLEPYPLGRGEFVSLVKPIDMGNLEQEALDINKKTREELEKAPERSVVWPQFCKWVSSFQKGSKYYGAPIAAGHNIINYDLIIAERLCLAHKIPSPFNKIHKLDLMTISFLWFESNADVANYKLDTFREYLGIDKEGAHDALVDVRQTGEILMKFQRLHRNFASKVVFRNAFKKETTVA